jgi:hypothetical protein
MVRCRGLVATLALLAAASPLAAQASTPVRDHLERVLRADRYQTRLPVARDDGNDVGKDDADETSGGSGGRSGHSGDSRSGRSDGRMRSGQYGVPVGRAEPKRACFELPSIGNWLLWAVCGVLVALVLFGVVRALIDWRRRPRPAAAAAPAAAATVGTAPALEDFEQLAAAGRFAEAVHAMLLQAFVLLAEQRGRPWPRAETGREILAAVGGFGIADGGLRGVFATVEGSHFGGRGVSATDFADCRQQFTSWRAGRGPAPA